ncbi:MAG: hypothetical protein ABH851_07995 [Methanobacteriota archaeon]
MPAEKILPEDPKSWDKATALEKIGAAHELGVQLIRDIKDPDGGRGVKGITGGSAVFIISQDPNDANAHESITVVNDRTQGPNAYKFTHTIQDVGVAEDGHRVITPNSVEFLPELPPIAGEDGLGSYDFRLPHLVDRINLDTTELSEFEVAVPDVGRYHWMSCDNCFEGQSVGRLHLPDKKTTFLAVGERVLRYDAKIVQDEELGPIKSADVTELS